MDVVAVRERSTTSEKDGCSTAEDLLFGREKNFDKVGGKKIRNSMTFESVRFPFQMCLSNLDRKDWERNRMEGIGSETYHFEEKQQRS